MTEPPYKLKVIAAAVLLVILILICSNFPEFLRSVT